MKKHNILLSTDIGTDVDDALALYLCVNSREIDIKGIYVTNGDVDIRARIARKILRLAKYNAPVCIGESSPLTPDILPYHTCFERILLSKKEYEQTLEEADIEIDGISHLEKTIMETNPEILSIAPLTNLAVAIKRNPVLEERIRRVFVMGGRENEQEHNFRHDILAAQFVFNSSLPIVVVPADVCDKFRLSSSYLTKLKRDSLSKYLSHMANVWNTAKEIEDLMVKRIKGLNVPLLDTLNELERVNPSFKLPQHVRTSLKVLSNYNMFSQDYQKMFDFYRMFKSSIKNLDYPFLRYIIGDFFERIERKDISVSDAYVIYSLLYPEKTERKKAEIKINDEGIMRVLPGDKHEIITDLDYRDFKEYLMKNLQLEKT